MTTASGVVPSSRTCHDVPDSMPTTCPRRGADLGAARFHRSSRGTATPGADTSIHAGVPAFSDAWCTKLMPALTKVRAAGALSPAAGDADTARSVRAWKLCMLVPHMLLTHAAQEGTQGRTELLSRFSRVAKATASARRGCRPQAQSGMCNNPQRRAFEVDLREATAGAKHFKFLAELFAEAGNN